MRRHGLLEKKIIILAIAFECAVVSAFAQMTIGRVITDRRLAWTDFQGKANESSGFSAITNWTVGYRAHADSFHADTVFLSFRVVPTFNNYTSWVKKEKIKKKKDAEALLRHEQGHYDLAIICAETLKQALQASVFFKVHYSAKTDSIADATIQLFTQIEDQYDLETNHMLNNNEQKRWNENIANLLNQISNVYHER